MPELTIVDDAPESGLQIVDYTPESLQPRFAPPPARSGDAIARGWLPALQPPPAPDIALRTEAVRNLRDQYEARRQMLGDDFSKQKALTDEYRGELASLGITKLEDVTGLDVVGQTIGPAIGRGRKVLTATAGDVASWTMGMPAENILSFARNPEAPLPIEEQLKESVPGRIGLGLAGAPVIVGAAAGGSLLGLPAWAANVAVMGFDEDGRVDPLGLTAALGLPVADRVGREFIRSTFFKDTTRFMQPGELRDLFQRVTANTANPEEVELAKLINSKLSNRGVQSTLGAAMKQGLEVIQPTTLPGGVQQAVEIAGGLGAANGWLLAVNLPGILASDNPKQALLETVAQQAAFSLMSAPSWASEVRLPRRPTAPTRPRGPTQPAEEGAAVLPWEPAEVARPGPVMPPAELPPFDASKLPVAPEPTPIEAAAMVKPPQKYGLGLSKDGNWMIGQERSAAGRIVMIARHTKNGREFIWDEQLGGDWVPHDMAKSELPAAPPTPPKPAKEVIPNAQEVPKEETLKIVDAPAPAVEAPPTPPAPRPSAPVVQPPPPVKPVVAPPAKTEKVRQADTPTKKLRAQKEYLVSALEKAIQEAPEEFAPEHTATAAAEDLKAKAAILAPFDEALKPLQSQGLKWTETDEAKAHFDAIEAALEPLFAKYGILKNEPGSAIYKTESGETDQGYEPFTRTGGDRRELLTWAIKRAHEQPLPHIEIEVPGDGTFTILNTKAHLRTFLETARKQFPSTALREAGVVGGPSIKAKPVPPVAPKVGQEEALKAAESHVSNDDTRYILRNTYSNGQELVSTDGRRLIRIIGKFGGTNEKPILRQEGKETTVEGRYPNFAQVIPRETWLVKGGADTAELIRLLRLAEFATSDKETSVKLYRNKDGTLGITAESTEFGNYEGNLKEGAAVIGAYSPRYLLEALEASRRLGNERVDLYASSQTDVELSPLVIRGKNHEVVLMPMRLTSITGAALPSEVVNWGHRDKPAYPYKLPEPLPVAEPKPAPKAKGRKGKATPPETEGGTSGVGRPREPALPVIPPGIPVGAHPGPMPVAMERMVPGKMDVPTVMRALERVVQVLGQESPIRTGRFNQQALGIFKSFSEVIRLERGDDIPTASHEVAHAVSKAVWGSVQSRPLMAAVRSAPAIAEFRALGKALYGSRKPVAGYTAEGFSEYLRLWLTTEDAAKRAPKADEWFEKTFLPAQPALAAALRQARDAIDIWRGEGALARVKAMTQGPPGVWERVKKFWDDMLGRRAQVEEFEPLEELSRGFTRMTGAMLRPAEDPFLLATARRGLAGLRLREWVNDGMTDIWGSLTGPPLREAVERIKPGDSRDFVTYLHARRALERWRQGKNPGMTQEDAAYLKQWLERPAFIEAARKWYAWWDGVLEYVKQSAPAVNGPVVEAIRKGSQDYVPLARVLDPAEVRGSVAEQLGGGMKHMHGSARPVREIMMQSLLVAERLINKAHRDSLLESIYRLSQFEGMGWLVEKVPRDRMMQNVNIEKLRKELEDMGVDLSGVPDDTILTFATLATQPKGVDPILTRKAGSSVEWYQVPARVYNSLAGLDGPQLQQLGAFGTVLDWALFKPARMFKLGTTGLRASFSMFSNPGKDLPTFLVQTTTGNPARAAAAYPAALFDIVRAGLTGKESEAFKVFHQLGISGANFVGGDIKQAQREARALFHGRVFRRIMSPIETAREAFSFTESAPRLAEMVMVGRRYGWEPGKPLTPDAAIAMTVAAKRVTTDFSAGGTVGKWINMGVPFYNATIQGTRSFARAFNSDQAVADKPYAAARMVLYGLAMFTVPTLWNWWHNKDKPWYRSLPWRERYLYTNVEGPGLEVIQLPRPPEWGNAFMVLPEMIMDRWFAEDPAAAQAALAHIFTTQNPLDYPVLLKAAKEQWQNRIEFFDRPIVPRGQVDLIPGEQRAYYSSTLAKRLGDAFPQLVSPRRVDAMIRQVFGGVGGDIAQSGSALLRALGLEESKEARDWELADLPVMGRAFRRGGEFSANNRFIGEFYDEAARMDSIARSVKPAMTSGRVVEMTPADWFYWKVLSDARPLMRATMDAASRARDTEARVGLYRSAADFSEQLLKTKPAKQAAR